MTSPFDASPEDMASRHSPSNLALSKDLISSNHARPSTESLASSGMISKSSDRARHAAMAALILIIAALIPMTLASCGYSLSSSPYRLVTDGGQLTLAIPVASNRSRYGLLGPDLTKAVIERLTGTPGLSIVAEGGDAKLSLTIVSVVIGSGSWDVVATTSKDTPEASASRTASITVDASLVRPNPDGDAPVTKRSLFSSSRTYMVGSNPGQVEMQETEALDWIIDDISQKIGLVMFNEF